MSLPWRDLRRKEAVSAWSRDRDRKPVGRAGPAVCERSTMGTLQLSRSCNEGGGSPLEETLTCWSQGRKREPLESRWTTLCPGPSRGLCFCHLNNSSTAFTS
jgi:hypothetical protein